MGHSFYSKFLQSKYLILLLALLFMLVVYPLTEDHIGSQLLFALFFLLTLIGIFYGLKGKRGVFVFMTAGAIVLCLNIVDVGFKQLDSISQILSVCLYFYAILLFCKDIYMSKEVTRDILLGSICVYLLIGLCFALIYMTIQTFDISAIIHSSSGTAISKSSDFYYFSFITLATVGFGDIIAQNTFARSLVMLEGVVGVFYIAILVARLVSVFNKLTGQPR